MNRIGSLTLIIGLAVLIVVGLACGAEEKQDPTEAGPASDAPQTQDRPGPSGEPAEAAPPVTGGGTPRAPRASLTYEGVVYYGNSLGREAAKFNEDDLELVGATTESNLIAPGSGESLKIYVMKGEAGNVYTLSSDRSVQIEDCPPGALDASQCTITMKALEDKWTRWSASIENTPEMIQAIRLISERERKRPNSIEGLVAQSHVIVLGTISSVLEEMVIGGYGEDGKPTPAGKEGGLPYTDYEVRIESVLKGDGALEDGGTLVLRMFGHRTQQTDVVTSVAVQLPETDSYYMFALGQNPDGTYGSGLERLINVDGDHVTFADGLGFYTELTGAEFVGAVRQQAGESSTTRDTSSFFENASGYTVAPQAPNEPDTEPDVVHQDESAALAPDIALTAKQTGLPVESVERAIAFQQAFAKYVSELIVRFPDQISAVWTEPIPNTRGHVQFIGEVPPEVTSEIERQGLLDPNNVVLTGGGMISRADHSRRAELAHQALVDLGYWNFKTFFDPIDNVISIEFLLPEGASHPSKLDLVAAVQNRVRAERDQSGEARFQGRAATVDALDLELTVITGSGPIVTLE